MTCLQKIYDLVSVRRRGSLLLSMFFPTLMFGEPMEASAQQRTYQPTKAQLRLEEQRQQQNAKISELRHQNTSRQDVVEQQQKALVSSSALKTRIRYTWHNSSRYLLLNDIAKYYRLRLFYTKNGICLRGADQIDLFYNKRIGSINGVNVYFTAPPVIRRNNTYLSEKDFLLVLDPVLRESSLARHSIRTIMIDPGHGGVDKGAPGAGGLLEKNLNLSMAMKVKQVLERMGFQVVMTRRKDQTLSLQERADLCKKIKPDLFLSIHCNAAGQKTISGIETFAMTPNGCASTSDAKPGTATGPGNSFDKNNYRMAYEIQKALTKTTGAEDRGVKHARFFVLRNATAPSVLIETGFISNYKEGRLLNQNAYQDKVANAIATGILNYRKAFTAGK